VASLVAVVALSVIRGVLDERRLVGMDASALSAFVGARGGRSAPPCEREIRKIKLTPLESGASGGAMAYLRVEKPHYLFLEGSTGAEATADVSTISLPDASAARVGTSAACAASSVDRPTVGASTPAPGTRSSVASAALGEGGAGSHLSRGACPHHFPPLLLPTTSTPTSPGEKVPAARAAGIPHPSAPGVLAAGSPVPSYAPPTLVPVATPRARVFGLEAWAGRTARRSRPPSAREDENVRVVAAPGGRIKEKGGRAHSPAGRWEA
jgi:hypothetical protein